jgi:hypothetical protein
MHSFHSKMGKNTRVLYLSIHARKHAGITTKELRALHPDMSSEQVTSALQNMKTRHHIRNAGTPRRPLWVDLHIPRAKLTPLHTAEQQFSHSKAYPGPSPKMSGPAYRCPELGPVPGLTADRMDAFKLPSRMGNWLHYPDGRKEPVPA